MCEANRLMECMEFTWRDLGECLVLENAFGHGCLGRYAWKWKNHEKVQLVRV